MSRRRFDVVVFSSPSTFRRLLEAAGGAAPDLLLALRRTAIVAIGPVSADALRQARLAVSAVAAEPSDDGIVRAVLSLFPP